MHHSVQTDATCNIHNIQQCWELLANNVCVRLHGALLPAIVFELPINQTPYNSNFFRFTLKVRVMGSQLYFVLCDFGGRSMNSVLNSVEVIEGSFFAESK